MNRVLAAARLNLIHPLVALGVPWMVVGLSFAINLALWGSVGIGEDDPDAVTGGVAALYITVMIVYIQAFTQLLPFAMGISLSRRTFYLGTALVAVTQAVVYGIVLSALTAIEEATGGWGVGLGYWAAGPMDVDNPALQVLVSGAPMLAFIAAGIGLGIADKRRGPNGIWGLTIASIVVFGGLALLATWMEAWTTIGSWLGDRSITTLAVGLPLVLAVVLAGLSWTGLRRVVP
ncbi:hypothetical protein [Blastococcus montanus]|uniref:hypothetical protein n=1 Tax=Blastococcus montanus TaxID=3144973 RepID=UPI00320A33CA